MPPELPGPQLDSLAPEPPKQTEAREAPEPKTEAELAEVGAQIEEQKEQALDGLEQALNEVTPDDLGISQEGWEAFKNLDFTTLFSPLQEAIDQVMMARFGVDEEQLLQIAAALPATGVAGYLANREKGYVEQPKPEYMSEDEWLWKSGCPFTFNMGSKPRVTSNPQKDRHTAVTDGDHRGVDIGVPEGTPLALTQEGRVKKVHGERASGLWVTIQFKDGSTATFRHLDEFYVKENEELKPGRVFARTGNTGVSTGAHLHLEARDKHNRPKDPFKLLGEETGMKPLGQNYDFPFGE